MTVITLRRTENLFPDLGIVFTLAHTNLKNEGIKTYGFMQFAKKKQIFYCNKLKYLSVDLSSHTVPSLSVFSPERPSNYGKKPGSTIFFAIILG